MKNILIADDHPLTLMGTRAFAESLGYRVIETCTSGIVALNSLVVREPDIALLDLNMPGMSGLEILEAVKQHRLRTRIVLLTMHNERVLYLKAKSLGAAGYLTKERAQEELEACLREVSAGGHYAGTNLSGQEAGPPATGQVQTEIETLSPAERKILALIAAQHSSKDIAAMLFISERTVENHRSNIIRKLDLPREKNALLVWAMKHL